VSSQPTPPPNRKERRFLQFGPPNLQQLEGEVRQLETEIEPRDRKFTPWHEFFLFVLFPWIVGVVVNAIWHPPIWSWFVIGSPSIAAGLHLLGVLRRRINPWRVAVVVAVFGIWACLAILASNRQSASELADLQKDVSNKIGASVHMLKSNIVTDSEFSFVNNSTHDIYVSFYECDIRTVVWDEGYWWYGHGMFTGQAKEVPENTPITAQRDRIEAGGDTGVIPCLYSVYNPTQLMAMTRPAPGPASAIKCIDIVVNLRYAIDEQATGPLMLQEQHGKVVNRGPINPNDMSPENDQSKKVRFQYLDGDWKQVRLDRDGGYCDYLKRQSTP
jgi:hypothetical protein